MFEEEPRKNDTAIGAILMIALSIGLLAVLYLLATKWGSWAH